MRPVHPSQPSVAIATTRHEIYSRLDQDRDQQVIAVLVPESDNSPLSEDAICLLGTLVKRLSEAFLREARHRQQDDFEKIVASYVDPYVEQIALSARVRREAEMTGRARRDVLDSTDWLTAQEISEFARRIDPESHAEVDQWQRERHLFSLLIAGVVRYPAYAFGDDFRPLTGLKSVLELFQTHKTDWGIAYWFAGANSYLGGLPPQAVLKSDPQAVLNAARQEVHPTTHG